MKRNIVIIAAVVIAILAVGGYFGWQQMTARAATTVRVPTALVERGSLIATVSAAGNLSAVKSTNLTFQVAGRVAQVNVQVGDNVKAGQVLMQLDTTDLLLSLKNSQAQLSSAKANLENASARNAQNPNQLLVYKSQLEKAIATLQQAQGNYNAVAWRNDVVSSQQAAVLAQATADYQIALANFNINVATVNDTSLKTAAASFEQAQVAVEQAQRNIEKARVVAPFDGTISAVNFNAGDSAGTAAVAVAMADVSVLQVRVTLAEVDVAKIRVGQTAQMTLDALPGATYTAEVTALAPVATITQGVVNYPVILSVKGPDTAIRPGMTANLLITVERRDNVLLIPSRAIRTQGNQRLVTVLYRGQSIQVPVTIGMSGDTMIEITSGLREGDEVVVQQTTTRQPTGFGVPGGGPGGFVVPGR